MNKDYTHIIVIGDRSGSMQTIISDAIGGFNTFIEDQKKVEGKATLTMALFDDKYELIHELKDIQDIEKITSNTWSPRGTTALLDAMGKTISAEKSRIKALDKKDRPDQVLVVVVTDGHENASVEYKKEAIKELVDKRQKKGWEFIFLAADMDAIADSASYGISADNSIFYNNTSDGNRNLFAGLSTTVKSYRTTNQLDASLIKDQLNEE